MSRYDEDPRVHGTGTDGYTVTRDDGTDYQVLRTGVFGWTICHGPNLDYVPTADGGFAIGYASADDAISDLLADHNSDTNTTNAADETGSDDATDGYGWVDEHAAHSAPHDDDAATAGLNTAQARLHNEVLTLASRDGADCKDVLEGLNAPAGDKAAVAEVLGGSGAGTEYVQAAADDEAVRAGGIAAWEQVMRARSADEAHAVVDRFDGPTLRVLTERMGLPVAESQAGMREQVAAAVQQRAEDLELYDQQPFDDLTGVPGDVGQRPCPRDGCEGTLRPVAGSQHFGADGGASVNTECDQGCGISSGDSWVWSTYEAPAEDPTYYPEDEDSGDPDDGGGGWEVRTDTDEAGVEVTPADVERAAEITGNPINRGDPDAYDAGRFLPEKVAHDLAQRRTQAELHRDGADNGHDDADEA